MSNYFKTNIIFKTMHFLNFIFNFIKIQFPKKYKKIKIRK